VGERRKGEAAKWERGRKRNDAKETHLSNLDPKLLLLGEPGVLFLSIHKLSSSLLLLEFGLLL